MNNEHALEEDWSFDEVSDDLLFLLYCPLFEAFAGIQRGIQANLLYNGKDKVC